MEREQSRRVLVKSIMLRANNEEAWYSDCMELVNLIEQCAAIDCLDAAELFAWKLARELICEPQDDWIDPDETTIGSPAAG